MSITVLDLVTAIGNDRIGFQNLDQCATDLNYTAKNGTRVTFGCDVPVMPGQGLAKQGLVLWIDRDVFKEVVAGLKERETK